MNWVDKEFKRLQDENMPMRAFCDQCRSYITDLVEKLMSVESLAPDEVHVVATFLINEQFKHDQIGTMAYMLMEEYLDQWWEAIHD